MKIILVGGSGFIGTHLIHELLELGHETTIYDKNSSNYYSEIETIGDVRDYESLEKEVEGVDVIYDLAAEHRDNVRPRSLYYEVNVGGAKNVVTAATENNINKIIFTSSVAVYGLNRPDTSETAIPYPFNDYGKSKLEAEGVYRKWVEADPSRTLVTIRPTVIFGENNIGNVYTLIKQIVDNKFLMVGQGNNRKSIAYVGNLVKFMIDTLDMPPGYHLFNFADKPDLSTKDLVGAIYSKLGMERRSSFHVPYGIALLGGYFFDILSSMTGKNYQISGARIQKFCANTQILTKSLEEFGFTPEYSIETGLERMIESILGNVGEEVDPIGWTGWR